MSNPVAKFRRIFEARLKSGKYEPIDVVQAVKGLATRAQLVDALDVYCALFDPDKAPQSRNSFELCRTTGYNLFIRALELSSTQNDLLELVQSLAPKSTAQVKDAQLVKRLSGYRKRYDALDAKDKDELQRRARKLSDDRAAEASKRRYLLDDLEKEFRNVRGRPPAARDELLSFSPGPPDARKEFERLAIACDAAWVPKATNIAGAWVMGQFVRTPGAKQKPQKSSVAAMQNVQSAFDAFGRFVEEQIKQPLDLFRLLAWAREPSSMYTTVEIRGEQTITRQPTSLWSALWRELYLDIAARGLVVAISRWKIPQMIQAKGYVGKDLDFVLAPMERDWKELLRRGLVDAFKSPRAFGEKQSQRRRAKVWGDVKGLELVDEVKSESLMKDSVDQFQADAKEVLERKIRLSTNREVYKQTYHIYESAKDVFTVLWIPRQQRTQIAYVEVHAMPGMLFMAQGDRVGLVELLEEKAFADLAANAAALTQFLLAYLQVLGYMLDVITAGASGGVRIIVMRFIEQRIKDKIIAEGLDLAGIDNPWVQTLVGFAAGMTPSLVKAPRVGAVKGLDELKREAQTVTRGARIEPVAPNRGVKNPLGSAETDARMAAEAKGGAGAKPKVRDERPVSKPPANENVPVVHDAPGAKPPPGSIAGRGLGDYVPEKYSDITVRRIAQVRQKAQEAARRAKDLDEAAEQQVASAAGAEGASVQAGGSESAAAERAAAVNDNAIMNSRGGSAPSRRPVTRQPEYVSRRNVNPGARYSIGRGPPVDEARLQTTVRSGHHVYMYHDAQGNLLYVGKSGGVLDHHDWVQRLQDSHMTSAWIQDARSVTVYYNLTEQEMWALEEVLIGRNPTGAFAERFGYALYNEKPGEYTKWFGEAGLGANAESALNRPVARFRFFADPLVR